MNDTRETLNFQQAFETQLQATRAASLRFHGEVQRLEALIPADDVRLDSADEQVQKLIFMKVQSQFGIDLIKLILAERARMEHDDFFVDITGEEQTRRNQFSEAARQVLERLERAYDGVAAVRTVRGLSLTQALQIDYNETVAEHPLLVWGFTLGGTALGAAVGSRFGPAGSEVGGLAGALIGALMGYAVAKVIQLLTRRRDRAQAVDDREIRRYRQEVEDLMGRLREANLENELLKARDFVDEMFVQPVAMANVDDPTCGICLCDFERDIVHVGDEMPTKTRNCVCPKRFHRRCLREWTRTGRLTCPHCMQ